MANHERVRKVYLAGFDVFRPDAAAHGVYLKQLCAQHGLIGLYPLDNVLPAGLDGAAAAAWICQKNMAMIQECDGVIGNLGLFRGYEPDSGTCVEVGVAIALGKPVWAYFPEAVPMLNQIPTDQDGYCAEGYSVENFGLPRNLMLACQWAGASQDAAGAIQAMSELLLAA